MLILLDTPGGLDTSMREIIKAIMDAKVPVIVYVYPQGARAASAGSIILLASHVAAMAPGTNAGAAHPVSIGKDEKPDKVMMKKVVQDAEAYAKSIAKKRGRNVDWAGKAVTQSVSATADDALRLHVIDLVAPTVDDLLMKIDGKTVEVGDKKVMSILVVVAVTVLFFVGVLSYAIKAQLSSVKTGVEGLIGEVGVARTDVREKGKVHVHGELWNAESDEPIAAGDRVIVTAVRGMAVKVKKERGEV